MLNKLRKKKTAKKIWVILAILVILAFVFGGAGMLTGDKDGGISKYAGKVYGRKISLIEYKDALQAVRTQALIQFGDNLSEAQKYLNLEARAWERILLSAEAKRRGIKVKDQEVVDIIQNYQFFQRNGKFDNRIYQELLKYAFQNQPRAFEEQVRQDLAISKLYKQVTESVKLDDNELRMEYEKANEEVSVYYIASLPQDFANAITATDEEVSAYFTANKIEFKEPLSFNLEYLTSESESKIQGLLPHLKKKEYFNKLAKDSGLEIKETGLFAETSPIPGMGWLPQVTELLFKIKVGQFLPPVKADNTYYLIRLKERKDPYIPEFDKIKEKVKEALIKQKSTAIAKEKINGCYEKLKQEYAANPASADFNRAAAEFGLKSDVTAMFKYESYIEGIGASDAFWIYTKSLKENEPSKVISLPSGFYIIKIKSRLPVDENKFKEESAEFEKKLLSQKQQERFTAFIEESKKNSLRF
ncbi:MAG: SurA N-terminal domain-containing protein [Candidatus Omnitrophota bacterium]